jgi:multidrug efflux pump subunit AcrA (membrane-fusion protein)
MKGDVLASLAGAVILIIIVIQIERQIILGSSRNGLLMGFRFVIAFLMAGIGSLIIDQIIFKDDIAMRNISLTEAKVTRDYPIKAAELKRQIAETDATILAKEEVASDLQLDVTKNPMIKSVTTQSASMPMNNTSVDSLGHPVNTITHAQQTTVTTVPVPNPNIEILKEVNQQIEGLRIQKQKQDGALLELRNTLQRDYNSKTGFLDELNVMKLILSESSPALIFWIVWIILLLGLELFITASKFKEQKNDYDETIIHQMELQKKQLALMKQAGEARS